MCQRIGGSHAGHAGTSNVLKAKSEPLALASGEPLALASGQPLALASGEPLALASGVNPYLNAQIQLSTLNNSITQPTTIP